MRFLAGALSSLFWLGIVVIATVLVMVTLLYTSQWLAWWAGGSYEPSFGWFVVQASVIAVMLIGGFSASETPE